MGRHLGAAAAATAFVVWGSALGAGSAARADVPASLPPASVRQAEPADGLRAATPVETRHTITTPAGPLDYTAATGTLPLRNAKGETAASIYYTAYVTAKPAGGDARPITFVFNGGPGAGSAFLHIGGLGPRILPFNATGAEVVNPPRMQDNPDTWLRFTDLVFVDPVGTGFSRAVNDEEARRYYGVETDSDAMADIVELYLTRTGRGVGPVYLAGASYGSFRSVLVARKLLRRGRDVRGLALISPALDFSLIWGGEVSLLPTALVLPSLACVSAEQKGGANTDYKTCEATQAFARGRYLTHLARGLVSDPAIEQDVAHLTGLSTEEIARRFGRITVRDFTRVFTRDTDRTLSLYDGAMSVAVPRPAREHHSDPLLDQAVAILGPAYQAYARDELGLVTDQTYKLLSGDVRSKWDFGTSAQHQGYGSVLDDIEDIRTRQPAIRIVVASGYTDLVTPFATARYMVDTLRPLAGAAPIEVRNYPGGHMMYLREKSRRALAADVEAMFRGKDAAAAN